MRLNPFARIPRQADGGMPALLSIYQPRCKPNVAPARLRIRTLQQKAEQMNPIHSLTTCVAVIVGTTAFSQATAQTRDLSTDRPDRTESAYTVPQGMWQVELDFANWTTNEDAGVETETLAVAPFNFKYGFGANTDIQFVVEPYVQSNMTGLGLDESVSGFGEVTVRVKQNIWGNDGGSTALAVMPFVTFPTADDALGGGDDVAGGVIVPLAIEIGEGMGAGLMVQVNAMKDSSDDYAPELVLSGTFAIDLTEQFGAYVELYASKFDDIGEETLATFDAGMTFSPESNLQFDAGANVGLNEHTDDLQIFVGMSRRW